MYRTTVRPQPRSPLAFLEGRFSMLAIGAFVLSGTLALATAVMPNQADGVVTPLSPVVAEAEADMKSTLDSRLHLHLKRLALR